VVAEPRAAAERQWQASLEPAMPLVFRRQAAELQFELEARREPARLPGLEEQRAARPAWVALQRASQRQALQASAAEQPLLLSSA